MHFSGFFGLFGMGFFGQTCLGDSVGYYYVYILIKEKRRKRRKKKVENFFFSLFRGQKVQKVRPTNRGARNAKKPTLICFFHIARTQKNQRADVFSQIVRKFS